MKAQLAQSEEHSHRVKYMKVKTHEYDSMWSKGDLLRRLMQTALIHEGMPFCNDPQLTEDDNRTAQVKRKRSLKSTHMRAPRKGVLKPCSDDLIMLHCVKTPKPLRVHASREPSSHLQSNTSICFLKVSSLSKHKGRGRYRVVLCKNKGQEYANGPLLNNYNGKLAHKGDGGKTSLKVRGDFPREPNSQSQHISNKPGIAKNRPN